jgi:hypothetical protein
MRERDGRVSGRVSEGFFSRGKRRRAGLGIFASASGIAFACGGNQHEELGILEQALTATVTFQQGVSSYSGTTDATLAQASPSANAGNATTCEVDGDDGSGVDKSCLIRWALSGIPSGAIVTAASIKLRAIDSSANSYDVYAVERAWTESQTTWNQAASSVPWGNPGALAPSDRGARIGSVTGSGTRTITLDAAGIALVQRWVNGGLNAGILIANASNTDGLDFAASQHGTASYRPKLSITYTTDPGGGTGGATVPNLLVAFIGDQGANGNSDSVLNLIKSEGAAAVVHNGDFDYADNPSAWNSRIDAILGANYPYFAVVGNHDAARWGGSTGYASFINARHARIPEMQCSGDLGVKASCRFRGLYLIESCVGTNELTGHGNCNKDSSEQVNFLSTSLASDSSIWSICSWHKNQNDMQIGTKGDEVGWNAYRACMAGGGIVSTGHEHSYARTLALTDLGNRNAAHGAAGSPAQIQLAAGRTFVFVSGLAGVGIRAYDAGGHDDDTWWASYYASNRWLLNGAVQSGSARYGALFIRFNVSGDPKRADAYFKDVNGRIADQFTIRAP